MNSSTGMQEMKYIRDTCPLNKYLPMIFQMHGGMLDVDSNGM